MYRGSRSRPAFFREALRSIRPAANSAREKGVEDVLTRRP
jgi:hypothetical protein